MADIFDDEFFREMRKTQETNDRLRRGADVINASLARLVYCAGMTTEDLYGDPVNRIVAKILETSPDGEKTEMIRALRNAIAATYRISLGLADGIGRIADPASTLDPDDPIII